VTSAVATDLEAIRGRVAVLLNARLPEHLERLEWDDRRRTAYQTERLRALLAHAVEHSPFHARRLAGIDPSTFELADLERLPTMTKVEMMEGFDELLTDRRLTRTLVEDHIAASTREPSLLLGEYVCLASGGSSCLRGVFVQSLAEYGEFCCSIVRRVMARLAAFGGPPPGGITIGMVAAASPVHSTAFGSATASGDVNAVSIPSTLPVEEIVRRLNELQPPALQGYPSKLVHLANEQRAGRLKISPFAVTATSEMSTPEDREAIGSAFGVPVVNQFGSTEGLVGHSEPGDSVLVFAEDMCLVELVDEDNRPVPDGVTSAKVLVTNLHNLTQPLIRYELTDRFRREPGDGPLRATVEGRADDVLHYGDVEVQPFAIRTVMVAEPVVVEYQVRQTERGADVSIVRDGDVDEDALAAKLADALAKAGVPDPVVTLEAVDAIPRHAETGKAKRFVPLRD
jgi:phenylacetate-coenzyme A ligase PaaK-like adenylate-forming protein